MTMTIDDTTMLLTLDGADGHHYLLTDRDARDSDGGWLAIGERIYGVPMIRVCRRQTLAELGEPEKHRLAEDCAFWRDLREKMRTYDLADAFLVERGAHDEEDRQPGRRKTSVSR